MVPQILRANFVAAIWKRVHLPSPCLGSPVGQGWLLDDKVYRLYWYDGDQLPKNIIIYKALGQSDSTVLEDEIEDEDTTYGDHLYGADELSDDDD